MPGIFGRRRLTVVIAGGVAVIAAVLVLCLPHRPAPSGLVDQPCPAGSIGRSAAMQGIARQMVANAPLNIGALIVHIPALAMMVKSEADHAKVDWPDVCLYRAANDAVVAGGGAKVVFLGDSITELWGVADPSLFTGGIVDRGISGQTSGQALLRFYPDVVALHPKAVHILIGTNDIAGNTGPERAEDIQHNISAMVDIAKAHGIRVVIGSLTPATAKPGKPDAHPAAQIAAMNRWLRDLASQQGLTYVDYFSPLATPDGGMRADYTHDGLHPKTNGYAVMRPLAQAGIEKALKAAP